jgi:polysaccharide export outer membrane protein
MGFEAMFRQATLCRLLGGVAFALLLGGCVSSSSRGGLFGGGAHREIEDAKNFSRLVCEPAAVPRELDKRNAPPYLVEPGDVLLVQPASLESPLRLPGDQTILPDGSILLGQYGRLIVSGKTLPEIETAARAQIQAQSKETVGPIIVRLVTRVSKVYYVLGEVNAPGAYVLNGRETVLDGIVTAGGLNDRASRKRIILSRPTKPNSCRVVLPVCYNQIVQLGDTTTNYQLAAGDRIYVPSQSFWEDVLHNKKNCPCNGPQIPCPMSGCDTGVEVSNTYAPALPAGALPPQGMPAPVPAGQAPVPLPFPRPTSGTAIPANTRPPAKAELPVLTTEE